MPGAAHGNAWTRNLLIDTDVNWNRIFVELTMCTDASEC